MSGTEGRVYGGDCDLVHIADGQRGAVGKAIAERVDDAMRNNAFLNKTRDTEQLLNQKLCPGCYMVVLFNAAVELGRANNQSLRELGATLSNAFNDLMICGDDAKCIESIIIKLEKF